MVDSYYALHSMKNHPHAHSLLRAQMPRTACLMLLATLLALLLSLPASADKVYSKVYSKVYKYRDSQGHWHFGDKKPASANYEEIATRQPRQLPDVILQVDKQKPPYRLIAENLLYAPIRLQINFEDQSPPITKLINAREKNLVHIASGAFIPKFSYRYLIGDPDAKPDGAALASPFAAFDSQKITQAFNGRFSHQHDGSRFAIDIALPVGTHVVAARSGIVVQTQGKFVMGGVSSTYFLDKANSVKVMHSDGSFAAYVHLLPDSIVVKPGDHVTEGDLLARSGSSGYSSGPHLHFALLVAGASQLMSIPFHLRDAAGNGITPQEGQLLAPARRPID